MERGVALASDVGFEVAGRVAGGKPWRTICDVAEEIDAGTIVMAPAVYRGSDACSWEASRPRSPRMPDVRC